MAIAGGAVHSIALYTDEDGVLHEGAQMHRAGTIVWDDLSEIIAYLDVIHNRTIYMKLEGNNLPELRKAFA